MKVQKWSPRRVGLLAGCVVGALLSSLLVVGSLLGVRPDRGARGGVPDVHAGAAVRPGGAERRVRAVRAAGVHARLSRTPPPRCATGWPGPTSELPDGGRIRGTFTEQCRVPVGRPLSRAGLQLGVEAYAGTTTGGTGQVLFTFPGGCVQLDYPAAALGRAELALPALRDAVRLVPRWRLDRYVAADHRRAGKAPVTERAPASRPSASTSVTTGPSRCRCCAAGCWSPAWCCSVLGVVVTVWSRPRARCSGWTTSSAS